MISTRARVSLALLSLRKNGGTIRSLVLRVHPRDQGNCPLERGVPRMKLGLEFVNNQPTNKISLLEKKKVSALASHGICCSYYFKELDNVLNSHCDGVC